MRSKTMRTLSIASALLALLVVGCSPDHPGHPTDWTGPTGASALTSYVAIGNSLTAGYMDSGLIVNGQLNSYPRFIALQMGLDVSEDSSEFTQPYVKSPGIGTTNVGEGIVAGVLYWNGTSIGVLGTTPEDNVVSLIEESRSVPTPYNNLGIPGAASPDLLGTLDSSNSFRADNAYFDFILRNGPDRPNGVSFMAESNQIHQGAVRGGTLTTVWIGSNDALLAALGGDPVMGGDSVVMPGLFNDNFTAAMGVLRGTAMAVYGFLPNIICANLPSITSIPYFVPEPVFRQAFINSPDNPTQLEPIYAENDDGDDDDVEMVTFPTIGAIENLVGVPIPSTQTLTASEVTLVEDAIIEYNTHITNYCSANGIPLVDARQALMDLQQNNPPAATHFSFLMAAGMTAAEAAETTYFSLDGVHPNNRGYAFVANIFMEVINASLGSSLTPVDLGSIHWDPTYGATGKTGTGDEPWLTPEAVAALEGMFGL